MKPRMSLSEKPYAKRPGNLSAAILLGALLAGASFDPAPAVAAPVAGELPDLDPATLVAIDEIKAPIVDSGRLDGILKVKLTVRTRTAQGAAALTSNMPQVRTALLEGVMEFARLHASPYLAVDVEKLRAILTPAARKVAPQIDAVLVTEAGAFAG